MVKMPPVQLEDFLVDFGPLWNFKRNPKYAIQGYSIQDCFCYVLPSLKRGRIDSISHTIPRHAPFRNYEDIRQHWKVTYGYRLPVDECHLFFNICFGTTVFTYPEWCIRCTQPSRFLRCDHDDICKSFLQDLAARMPNMCHSPLKFTKESLFWKNDFPTANRGNQLCLGKQPSAELQKYVQPFQHVRNHVTTTSRWKPFQYVDMERDGKKSLQISGIFANKTTQNLRYPSNAIQGCSKKQAVGSAILPNKNYNQARSDGQNNAKPNLERTQKSSSMLTKQTSRNIVEIPDSPALEQIVPDDLLDIEQTGEDDKSLHEVSICRGPVEKNLGDGIVVVSEALCTKNLDDEESMEEVSEIVPRAQHLSNTFPIANSMTQKNGNTNDLIEFAVPQVRDKNPNVSCHSTIVIESSKLRESAVQALNKVGSEEPTVRSNIPVEDPTTLGCDTSNSIPVTKGIVSNKKIVPTFKKTKKTMGMCNPHAQNSSQQRVVPSFGKKTMPPVNFSTPLCRNDQKIFPKLSDEYQVSKKKPFVSKKNIDSSVKRKLGVYAGTDNLPSNTKYPKQSNITPSLTVPSSCNGLASASRRVNKLSIKKPECINPKRQKSFCATANPHVSTQAFDLAMEILSQSSQSEISSAIFDCKLNTILQSPVIAPSSSPIHKLSSSQQCSYQESQQTPDSTVVKKQRSKQQIQENIDVEKMARNKQLKKVNAATLRSWLRSKGVSCKAAEKKEEMVKRTEMFLNIFQEELVHEVKDFLQNNKIESTC
ncbi:uncharacterized protein LOC130613372 isoform X2 [Hydractinia symbiolongicarpus]|nr:uncharacterized protein LOC130613372 isoform X2 [Hydractinia symbiolongicarpus]